MTKLKIYQKLSGNTLLATSVITEIDILGKPLFLQIIQKKHDFNLEMDNTVLFRNCLGSIPLTKSKMFPRLLRNILLETCVITKIHILEKPLFLQVIQKES